MSKQPTVSVLYNSIITGGPLPLPPPFFFVFEQLIPCLSMFCRALANMTATKVIANKQYCQLSEWMPKRLTFSQILITCCCNGAPKIHAAHTIKILTAMSLSQQEKANSCSVLYIMVANLTHILNCLTNKVT